MVALLRVASITSAELVLEDTRCCDRACCGFGGDMQKTSRTR